MPQLIALVGPSGSGKTTLLERLVPALQAVGLKVGVIKNDAHGFQIDTEGKDSDRLFKAGAHGVLIQSPSELAYRAAHADREEPSDLAERFFADCDLVLVEGAKWTALQKIELWHSKAHTRPLDPPPSNRIAFVADTPKAAACVSGEPSFTWNDIELLRDFVVARVEGRSSGTNGARG